MGMYQHLPHVAFNFLGVERPQHEFSSPRKIPNPKSGIGFVTESKAKFSYHSLSFRLYRSAIHRRDARGESKERRP